MKKSHLLFLSLFLLAACNLKTEKELPLPNILMITSEDNSAYFLGCYGNET